MHYNYLQQILKSVLSSYYFLINILNYLIFISFNFYQYIQQFKSIQLENVGVGVTLSVGFFGFIITCFYCALKKQNSSETQMLIQTPQVHPQVNYQPQMNRQPQINQILEQENLSSRIMRNICIDYEAGIGQGLFISIQEFMSTM
ncbi:Hypothetical_protein [Hexamita inflata]|uniref:Hypothetical_protein n=1 Tax=Hexamita inflata TaxID=28002 RepID=A0ABP1HY81_9EUKA